MKKRRHSFYLTLALAAVMISLPVAAENNQKPPIDEDFFFLVEDEKPQARSKAGITGSNAKPEAIAKNRDQRAPAFTQPNFRITTALGQATYLFRPVNLMYWRLRVDYLMTERFSLSAQAQLPLASVASTTYRTSTLAAGINLHLFRYRRFGVYLGASAGYTIVEQENTHMEVAFTPAAITGITYDFEFWHLDLGVSGQATTFENRDLSQVMVYLGAGFHLNI